MIALELAEGAISIDAALIAPDLNLDPPGVLEAIRTGHLTALCEQGIAEDAGRFRLTFYHANRQLRVIVDQQGRVLERSAARLRPQPGHSSSFNPIAGRLRADAPGEDGGDDSAA